MESWLHLRSLEHGPGVQEMVPLIPSVVQREGSGGRARLGFPRPSASLAATQRKNRELCS